MSFIRVDPQEHYFGEVGVGSRYTKQFKIYNYREQDVLMSFRFGECSHGFELEEHCQETLSPGESCTVTVYLQPEYPWYHGCNFIVTNGLNDENFFDAYGITKHR